MKKKWIFIISAVLIICLVFGGIVAFRKVRDYAAGRVIKELAQTEEVKKYEEQIKNKVEEEAGQNIEATEAVPTPESTKAPEVKRKSVWDEPLVQNVYARFSASEVSTVTGMLAGGLTREEKRYIKGLVYSRVSAAEISQLMEIYNKYY